MLEGCAEDKYESYDVPKGHRFAEHPWKPGGCLCVGALGQFVQLRVNEGSHGELVTCHEPRDGCGGYVVGSSAHIDIGCGAIVRRIVKWEFKRSLREWHIWFLTRDSRLRWKGWMNRRSILTLGRRFTRMFRRSRGASGWN